MAEKRTGDCGCDRCAAYNSYKFPNLGPTWEDLGPIDPRSLVVPASAGLGDLYCAL